MPYELKREDIFLFAGSIGADTHEKGNELWFKYCPYCRSKDKDTFSINLNTGAFKCFRASCGKQGHFVELCRDFGFKLDFGEDVQRKYRALPQKSVTVREAAINYLAGRGISREVAQRYKITTVKNNDNVLVFPFYDEQNVLQFVKYRKTNFKKGKDKNKEWCENNTKPILFGMAQCKDFKSLIITEGQLDSLSLATAGIDNAVSVPTGAMGFTWVQNCWEWLQKFEDVIVFGDCEGDKITLVDELSKRLPKLKVIPVEYYLGEKDANDILRKYGTQALVEAVEHAQIQPVRRIKRLADVERVDLSTLPKIETGIKEIDRAIGGIHFGQVTLLTGKRGEGKSTFMSQIAAEALNQGYKILAYSGELADYHFKSWLDFQLAGNRNVEAKKNRFGDDWYSIPGVVSERINSWYSDEAYIYDNNVIEDDNELEGLLITVEKAIQRYGINLVCIDNLMTAIDIDVRDDLYRAQSKFVHGLKKMAVKYNVAVILVAHPRKGNNGDKNFDNDDISGSGDITNRVDVVMCYSRSKDESNYDSQVVITKNRLTGVLISNQNPVKLLYSPKSKRITSLLSGEPDKVYGWEKDDWINVAIEAPMEEMPF